MKKKSLIGLIALSTMLVSCGSMTYDEAKAFVKENYSQEAAAEKYSSGSYKSSVNVKKASGVFEGLSKAAGDTTGDAAITVLNEAGLAVYGESANYSASGKSLTITYKITAEDLLGDAAKTYADNVKGSGKSTYKYNAYGLIVSSKSSSNFTLDYTIGGITFKGEYSMTSSVTYTYTAK